MPEYVRVTDLDTGHKLSIAREALPHGNFRELKQDAVDPLTGDPLPPEFNAVEPAGQKATTTKEQS